MEEYKFIEKIAQLFFVKEIWLYGSRARKDNSERSDIDLAIVCPEATEKDWQKILEIIENADTLLKIDCIRFDQLKDGTFKNNILKYKEILYQKG